LHEALVAAGAKSLITTPTKLSPERRRKNDRLDARELCVRLARHLDGHAHELRPIRIPSQAERERREQGWRSQAKRRCRVLGRISPTLSHRPRRDPPEERHEPPTSPLADGALATRPGEIE
jgi:transposase